MLRQADKQLKARWRERFLALPEPARQALREALLELREDALARAQVQWARHKGPMALYWKVVGVYAGYLCRQERLQSALRASFDCRCGLGRAPVPTSLTAMRCDAAGTA